MKYRCSNCGQIFDGQLDKCPNCGKKLKYKEAPKEEIKEEQPVQEEPKVEEQPKVEEPKQEVLAPAPVEQNEVAPVEEKKEEEPVDLTKSKFDGYLIQLIGWSLLGGLLTLITLGLMFPWALVKIIRWFTKHTTIDGRRLEFRGRAMAMFWKNVLYIFLTIITLTIFGWWVPMKWVKWVVANTHFKAEQ